MRPRHNCRGSEFRVTEPRQLWRGFSYNQSGMIYPRQLWRAVLILLVLIGTVSSQTASLASHHSHEHISHCCGVCHAGHLSLLQTADHFTFIPPALLCWHRPVQQATVALE